MVALIAIFVFTQPLAVVGKLTVGKEYTVMVVLFVLAQLYVGV